jgi:hypothetical protein
MLLELLEYALTACPRPVRAMGYLKEAIAIRSRVGRVREHWQEHIDHCHSMIRRAMGKCQSRRKAIILGGGLLNDVPIAELASTFRDVILVDIVHPFFSRWPTRRLRNVHRLAADVTDTINALYWVSDEPDLPLPKSAPTLLLDDAEIDLTISVNLLSQLPCMPMSYLERQRAHSHEAILAYARNVMQAHLDHLRRLPGRVVLITDVERLKIDMLRRVVERKDLLFGLKLPQPDEEWEWRLAPCPEADSKHDFFRRVVGFEDWKSNRS